MATLPPNRWATLPPRSHGLGRKNVEMAFKRLAVRGVNAYRTPVVVDCNSSPRFSTFKVNQCPCLTRTRAGQPDGYWCSTKGGYLDVDELALLQGIDARDLNWRASGITAGQYGQCLGNAMSLNVLAHLLPRVLFNSGIIGYSHYSQICRNNC